MKKYIVPTMVIVKIGTSSVIATSVGFNSTSVDASQAQGRESSFEDEEY